jgi:hypothetical protein
MKRLGLILLVVIGLVVAVLVLRRRSGVEIPFAEDGTDLARVEFEHPLALERRVQLRPADLSRYSQEQIDQIYARLTSGPIPNGPYDGGLFFPRGSDGNTRLGEIVGGRLKGRLANLGVRKAELLGRTLWKGKVFYRDQRLLRNRIEDLALLKPLISNPQSVEMIDVAGRDAFLLFPAKLYCGQSLLDGRRESIVIDYALTDQLPGYQEQPDWLAGRHGFRVRDEIRMVRPGFYLGRAYLNRIFALNFTLLNEEVARAGEEAFRRGGIEEDCWTGTQVARR